MSVTGWKLDPQERAGLLARFPPAWPNIVADHITLDADANASTPLPRETQAEIVGTVSDGKGLEALVVAVGGTTDRPDGSTYHITWSIDQGRGRRPVESNSVIAERGWRPLDSAVPVSIRPARF